MNHETPLASVRPPWSPRIPGRHQRNNLLASVSLSAQHDPAQTSRNQRKRISIYVRLARLQGGFLCHGGYVVPCYYCRWWMPLAWATVEHLVNKSAGGGGWRDGNLRLVHHACNLRRNKYENARARPKDPNGGRSPIKKEEPCPSDPAATA